MKKISMTSLFLMTSSLLSNYVIISKNPHKSIKNYDTSLYFGRNLAIYILFWITSRKCTFSKFSGLHQHLYFCWCQQKLKLQFLAIGLRYGHKNWTGDSFSTSLHNTIKKFHINPKNMLTSAFFRKFENWWRHHVMTSSQ